MPSPALKLLKIYDVVKDETLLVDLVDEELNVESLVSAIKERGKRVGNAFQQLGLYSTNGQEGKDAQILVFRNMRLGPGRLPEERLRETSELIHIVPADVDPHVTFSVTVKVLNLMTLSDCCS